jgi:hypothetical protein
LNFLIVSHPFGMRNIIVSWTWCWAPLRGAQQLSTLCAVMLRSMLRSLLLRNMLRYDHRREASWCWTPFGGSTIIVSSGVFNIMIEGRRLSLRDITARSADEIFYFYSLANGQSIVRESGPFVRRSSRH